MRSEEQPWRPETLESGRVDSAARAAAGHGMAGSRLEARRCRAPRSAQSDGVVADNFGFGLGNRTVNFDMKKAIAGKWVGWCGPMRTAACVVWLSVAGCGGGDGPTDPAPPSVERQILATATDSAILAVPDSGEAPHWAINPSPSVAAKGRLLVFLPGTQGVPGQYTYILRAGAARGLHAVGINYPNQTAMGSLCQFSLDPACYWTARNHVIFGTGGAVPNQAVVSPADSIVNRLSKLILWLDTRHPAEGWGQYLLADKTVDWSKVVLAGHSQGGGHAGVLAKSVTLSRAVYFSSPEDWNELTNSPAAWTSARPNVTPSARQYGFGSDRDTLVPNAHAFAHWDRMGLARPVAGPLLVDDTSGALLDSRQLRTGLPPNPASTALTPALRNHGITVVDTSTPLAGSGKPLFDVNGVWAYLCFD